MRKILCLVAFALLTQQAIAGAAHNGKACGVIAKACLTAGYDKNEGPDKQFWHDCMRPVILGKTVDSVTVDMPTIKECRTDKIAELKQEIKDIQGAMKK